MNADGAISLLTDLLKTSLMIDAPLLIAALIAGVVVGVIQTATQINEPSVSFIVKIAAVIATIVFVGPTIATHVVSYTTASLRAVAHVVR